MVTFFDTSRCRFAKFPHLFRTFHTSLSFVAYDSMEFHLTGSYGRDVAHVKEILSLFLSAWKVPHATCLYARDALDAKFFGEHIPQAWNARGGLMERYCTRRFLDAEFYEKSASKSYVNSNHRLAKYQQSNEIYRLYDAFSSRV